jgi:hypothetical protein
MKYILPFFQLFALAAIHDEANAGIRIINPRYGKNDHGKAHWLS